MATLFVLDVPEFAPLHRAARQAGLAVRQADGGYLRFDGAPELALERARAGLGKAVWYGALTAGYVGRVVRFDDDRLVISDAPCADARTRPARALPGVQFHDEERRFRAFGRVAAFTRAAREGQTQQRIGHLVPFDQLAESISDDTDLVAFSLTRSQSGETADLGAIVAAAKAVGAQIFIDGTQAFPFVSVKDYLDARLTRSPARRP